MNLEECRREARQLEEARDAKGHVPSSTPNNKETNGCKEPQTEASNLDLRRTSRVVSE